MAIEARHYLFDAQEIKCLDDLLAINAIPIRDQILRGRIEGEGLDQLQARPVCGRIGCDVEVDDASPVKRHLVIYAEARHDIMDATLPLIMTCLNSRHFVDNLSGVT